MLFYHTTEVRALTGARVTYKAHSVFLSLVVWSWLLSRKKEYIGLIKGMDSSQASLDNAKDPSHYRLSPNVICREGL